MPSSTSDSRLAVAAAAAAGAALIGAAAALEYARRRGPREDRPPAPSEWRRVGDLSQLYFYPIKSCAPVMFTTLDTTECGLRFGIHRDRALAVVDRTGRFVSARSHPKLVLVTTSIDGDVMTLSTPDDSNGKVSINVAELKDGARTTISVWGDPVPAVDCGDAAAAWLRKVVVEPQHGEATAAADLRLVHYPEQHSRRKGQRGVTGIYSDKTSYMLMTEASVADLNGKLSEPVSERRFRPNFYVRGPEKAFEEDDWSWVRIGENAIFRVLQPCTRCLLTTVDPETGIKSSNMEPLKTLRSYRTPEPELRKIIGDSPMMGAMMSFVQSGTVSPGDAVYVA